MVKIGSFGILYDDDPNNDTSVMTSAIQAACLIIGPISCCAGILVALSFILSKNLRSHPSFLVVLICICESIATYHLVLGSQNVTSLIKNLKLNELFYCLLFGMNLNTESSGIHDKEERYAELLCEANNMLVNAFSLGSIMFNTCLCIDLILTLRSPFSPPHKRNKFFIGCTVVIAAAVTFFLRGPLKVPCRKENLGDEQFQYRSTPATVFFLGVFMIAGISSIIYTRKRVSNTYGEKRKVFYRKHVLYVIFFIAIWTLYSISNGIFTYCYLTYSGNVNDGNKAIYDTCFSKTAAEPYLRALTNIGIISGLLGGTVLGIIRMSEPFFMTFLKVQLSKVFCCTKREDPKIKAAEANLSKNNIAAGFLLSSLNVELVQNILHAFKEVISAENVEIHHEKALSKRQLKLLAASKSIHMMEKIEIDPTLLTKDNESKPPSENGLQLNDEELKVPSASVNEPKKKQRESDPVKFVEFAPRLFYKLREKRNVNNNILEESFDPKDNQKAAFKAGESQGKSGSFFFFTFDRKFLIKTMSETEYKVFMDFLPTYYSHCIKHTDCMIAHILGIFKLRLPGLVPLYFLLMENSIRIENKEQLLGIFDLKGSTINRDVDETNTTITDTLKDMNFRRRIENKNFMRLTKQDANKLFEALEKDVNFFRDQKLMDYSLLLAVTLEAGSVSQIMEDSSPRNLEEEMDKLKEKYLGHRNIYVSPKGYVYRMGLIDYLQKFDTMKILENRFKRLRHGQKKMEGVSAIEPERYSTRFLGFIKRWVTSAIA